MTAREPYTALKPVTNTAFAALLFISALTPVLAQRTIPTTSGNVIPGTSGNQIVRPGQTLHSTGVNSTTITGTNQTNNGYLPYGGFYGYPSSYGYGYGYNPYLMDFGGQASYNAPYFNPYAYGYGGYNNSAIAVTPNGVAPLAPTGGDGYPAGDRPFSNAYIAGYNAAMAQRNAAGANRTGYAHAARVPHGSDRVHVRRLNNGQVSLQWVGTPANVSTITFALTDRNGQVLRQETVPAVPGDARFTVPSLAKFYQATVRYIDGANETLMSPIK